MSVFKAIDRFQRRRIYRRFLAGLVSYYGNLSFDHWRELLCDHPGIPIDIVYPLGDMFPRARKDEMCSVQIMPTWAGASTDQIRIAITLDEVSPSSEVHLSGRNRHFQFKSYSSSPLAANCEWTHATIRLI